MEEETESRTARTGHTGVAGQILHESHWNQVLDRAAWVSLSSQSVICGWRGECSSADVALNTLSPHPDYVGIICTKAVSKEAKLWSQLYRITAHSQNVHDICHEAIENARFVCEDHYALFRGPPIQLLCPKDLTFAYVPGHL